jgi:hypothetical protein
MHPLTASFFQSPAPPQKSANLYNIRHWRFLGAVFFQQLGYMETVPPLWSHLITLAPRSFSMMDPLSCAASIIAVIQLTGSIVGTCGGYINKVKNAQKDIVNLQQEISGLGEVLKMLNKLLRGPDGKKLTAL